MTKSRPYRLPIKMASVTPAANLAGKQTKRSGGKSAFAAAIITGTMAASGGALAFVDTTVPMGGWDITSAWLPDSNISPGSGQTDKGGDRKNLQVTLRKEGRVISFDTGLITPQGVLLDSGRVALRDTGYAALTYGYENDISGTYFTLGAINGPITPVWQDVVKWAHGGHARTSDPSSGFLPYVSVSARIDQAFAETDFGFANAQLTGTVFGMAGTYEVSAGASLFASLNFNDAAMKFSPNLPGMPLRANAAHTSVYAGIITKARAFDLPTHELGTYPWKVTSAFGAATTIGNFKIGAEYQIDLTPDVRNGWDKPVNRGFAYVNLKF